MESRRVWDAAGKRVWQQLWGSPFLMMCSCPHCEGSRGLPSFCGRTLHHPHYSLHSPPSKEGLHSCLVSPKSSPGPTSGTGLSSGHWSRSEHRDTSQANGWKNPVVTMVARGCPGLSDLCIHGLVCLQSMHEGSQVSRAGGRACSHRHPAGPLQAQSRATDMRLHKK